MINQLNIAFIHDYEGAQQMRREGVLREVLFGRARNYRGIIQAAPQLEYAV